MVASPNSPSAPFLQPAALPAARPLTPSKAALAARLLDAHTLFLRIGGKRPFYWIMQIRTALVTNMIQKPTINRNTRNITAVRRQINNLCQKRFGLTNIQLAMRTRRMKLRVGQWPSLLPTTINITQLLPGQHRSQQVRGVPSFSLFPPHVACTLWSPLSCSISIIQNVIS